VVADAAVRQVEARTPVAAVAVAGEPAAVAVDVVVHQAVEAAALAAGEGVDAVD
jgi:hypothetical protein